MVSNSRQVAHFKKFRRSRNDKFTFVCIFRHCAASDFTEKKRSQKEPSRKTPCYLRLNFCWLRLSTVNNLSSHFAIMNQQQYRQIDAFPNLEENRLDK